ncbi:hypothetical protein [Shinella kummerowiae]|uniref:hypothetical protein n=1 Tax=Shinella kummerowiae TaxID=417745 RepID=UPI0021B681BC|nr:hypothetical protein [Shinella kummerowiae]MCT7667644.1 hypothetical protein [Shinella kummerowiae]
MGTTIYTNPNSPDGFAAVFLANNVELPLEPSSEDAGVLLDAQGRDVITIDVNGERPDEEVYALTAYLCMAINGAGGFKVLAATSSDPEDAP